MIIRRQLQTHMGRLPAQAYSVSGGPNAWDSNSRLAFANECTSICSRIKTSAAAVLHPNCMRLSMPAAA